MRDQDEIGYVSTASLFFSKGGAGMLEMMNEYVDRYGEPDFIYNLVVDQPVSRIDHRLCNFSFWMWALLITYHNSLIVMSERDHQRAVVSMRAGRCGSECFGKGNYIHELASRGVFVLENYIVCKDAGGYDDESLMRFFDEKKSLRSMFSRVFSGVGGGVRCLPKLEDVVDIWEFVTHPEVKRILDPESD